MEEDEAFKYINELFIQFINSRKENFSNNAQATSTSNTASSTSNVTSTSAKFYEGTITRPQKRTASPSLEEKSIKRLMKTSTNEESDVNATTSYHFDNRNGISGPISSTPDIKPTVTERYEGEINIISALGNTITLTSENKSNEVSSTETFHDSGQSVNNENVQIQNTNDIGNDLINNSAMIANVIPEIPKVTTISINEEEKYSQVKVSSEDLYSCSLSYQQTVNAENVQTQNTNNIGDNLIDDSIMIVSEIPETPKPTTIIINEEEKDGQVEVSSEGLYSHSIYYEPTVDTENVQTQNTNNIRDNNLINNSIMIADEIPETPKTTTFPVNEEEKYSQVEVSTEGLYDSSICYEPTVNTEIAQTQNTNKIGNNNLVNNFVTIADEIPETPKTTTIPIIEEEKYSQVEVSSEGLYSRSICYEPTVNTEIAQIQNTNNIENNNLIYNSIMIADEIPETPKTSTIPIIEEEKYSQVEVSTEGLYGSSICYEPTVNTEIVQIQSTNKIGNNNVVNNFVTIADEIPETPKTTTITINEKEKDSQVEVSSEGLPSCPICFETLQNKEVSATTCGHVFCKGCILAVIGRIKRCPICRKPLTKRKLHQLFI